MNYYVIIISEEDLPDDPALVYSFKAVKMEDFDVALRTAVAEWGRHNPDRDFVEGSCTVLIEKAQFDASSDVRLRRCI